MKIRLGTLTGSPETGTGSTGMYWNDAGGLASGVSFIDYTDKRGRARRIWPDSQILHIQGMKLDLSPQISRLMGCFVKQRSILSGQVGTEHVMTLSVNGRVYNVFDTRNARWDAATNTLLFLRNSGPTPGKIVRGDYATVEMRSVARSITLSNKREDLHVLVQQLAPVTTCDVVMTAGWRYSDSQNTSEDDRGHVLLFDESGRGVKEAMGQYAVASKKKKKHGSRTSATFWDGVEAVRGITYNGRVSASGPIGRARVQVSWPAYQASFTVRVVDVVVG